jgi:glucose/arabinose dehydrogenase
MRNRFGVLATLLLALSACGDTARLPAEAGTGANPELPPPHRTAIPTVHIAQAKGWSGDATPQAADGLAVRAYASGLDHPRWVYVLPNGDVLVAETNAPPTGSRCCATLMATALPRRARCF